LLRRALKGDDIGIVIEGKIVATWMRSRSVPANLPRLEKVTPPSDLSSISNRVVAAVDVFNPPLGERGAARFVDL
jgi:hypothetical protein